MELTGEQRTGCTFCLFGIVYDPERLLRLKEKEPTKYDFVMRGGCFDDDGYWIPTETIKNENGEVIQEAGLGYKFVIDWLNENVGTNIKY